MVILIEPKDCPNETTGIESRNLLHDETDFVSGNDYTVSQTRTTHPCIGYDGTWAELSWGE